MKFTFGSLFDGIGGFTIAFERAGMECLWRSELDKFCNAQMEKRHPNIPNLGDVRNVTKDTAESVDLVCGGFPCTDLSVAGKRAGLAGEQSGLWYEFHRVIEELRPRWVVIENVRGLLSSSGGRDMGIIIGALAKLRYGYAWTVLDAQYRGLAQRRKRVFIVANSRDWTYPAQVLFESSCVPGSFETSRGAGEETAAPLKAGSPSRRNGGSSPIEDEFIITGPLTKRFAGASNQWAPWNEAEHLVAMSINSRNNRLDAESQTLVSRPLAFGKTTNHGDESQQTYIVEQNNMVSTPDMISLRANPAQPVIAIQTAQTGANGRNFSEKSFYTLDGSNSNAVALPSGGVRRLTPLECERLQGFDDYWTAGNSDTQRYKQLGNAVAVPVVQWIGERIMEVAAR